MKREHYITQSTPLGCVFLAPLNENDLKDYISGNSFVISGSMTWDSNEGAYLVTLGNVGSRAAHIVVPDMGITTQMTTVYEYRDVGTTNFRVGFFGSAYAGGDSYPYALPFVFGGARGSSNQWKKFVITWDNGSFKAYKNGILYNTQTISTTINTTCNTGISIGYVPLSSHYGSYYVKNMRIYNRILSAEEISAL